MSINDQLSFIAGLIQAPEEKEGVTIRKERVQNDDLMLQGPSNDAMHFTDDDNLVFFGDSADIIDYKTQKRVEKLRKELDFRSPGELMTNSCTIGIRKTRLKREFIAPVEKEKEKDHVFHDVEGRLVVNGESFIICDCLVPICSGCHSPCLDCRGNLCGPTCQKGRKEAIIRMEVSGRTIRTNPYLPK